MPSAPVSHLSSKCTVAKTIAMVVCLAFLLSQLVACFPLAMVGVGAGVVLTQDRRATSTQWLDTQIARRISNKIDARYQEGNIAPLLHVTVNSFNGIVLLTGEAPNQRIINEVESLARFTPDVKKVYNQLAIMEPSTSASRLADSELTARIKANMINANRFLPGYVKVITERREVYLMGLVSRQEGNDAAAIAANILAVEKVVKYLEYLE